jgi:hypothetical protein
LRPPPTPGTSHADRTATVPTSSLKNSDSASVLSNRLAKDTPLGAGASSHVDADAVALAAEVASANRYLYL